SENPVRSYNRKQREAISAGIFLPVAAFPAPPILNSGPDENKPSCSVESEKTTAPWVKLMADGKLGDAVAALEGRLAESPDDVDACGDLGVAYARQRRFEDAATRFRGVLERAPKRVATWRNLARAYGDLNRHEEAEPCLLKACELEPNVVSNHK